MAITPGGVWVIDAKRYKGERAELRVDGGTMLPRVEKLFVRGSDKTALVEGVLGQVHHVRAAVGDSILASDASPRDSTDGGKATLRTRALAVGAPRLQRDSVAGL